MEAGFIITLAQVEPSPDPRANLEKARTMADKAAARGADLIVFPEMFMGLPSPECPPARIAAAHGRAFSEGLADVASQFGLAVAAGCWEEGAQTDRAFNVVRIFSPEGREVAAYRKVHLFDALSVRESDTMAPGNALPPVVELAGVHVGVAICYDLRFPELFRHLALQGAQVIILPSAWYQGPVKEEHWRTLLQARAIENTLYMAGCNLVGYSFCGRSALFDPFGIQIVGAGEGEQIIVGAIDPERIRAVRKKLPSLENRRLSIDCLQLGSAGEV
ncbi:MAG: carbon-nitrogen hydrolase family protein [Desulfobacterales bacterium]|jgi:predicted amidohydrolase|nr:carbon-nitrogen hydrolase family protein [Desulfobacterales bacterium]